MSSGLNPASGTMSRLRSTTRGGSKSGSFWVYARRAAVGIDRTHRRGSAATVNRREDRRDTITMFATVGCCPNRPRLPEANNRLRLIRAPTGDEYDYCVDCKRWSRCETGALRGDGCEVEDLKCFRTCSTKRRAVTRRPLGSAARCLDGFLNLRSVVQASRSAAGRGARVVGVERAG
jgi:hypothetical protein